MNWNLISNPYIEYNINVIYGERVFSKFLIFLNEFLCWKKKIFVYNCNKEKKMYMKGILSNYYR